MAAAKHAKNILITLQSCEIMTRCQVSGFFGPRARLFWTYLSTRAQGCKLQNPYFHPTDTFPSKFGSRTWAPGG